MKYLTLIVFMFSTTMAFGETEYYEYRGIKPKIVLNIVEQYSNGDVAPLTAWGMGLEYRKFTVAWVFHGSLIDKNWNTHALNERLVLSYQIDPRLHLGFSVGQNRVESGYNGNGKWKSGVGIWWDIACFKRTKG